MNNENSVRLNEFTHFFKISDSIRWTVWTGNLRQWQSVCGDRRWHIWTNDNQWAENGFCLDRRGQNTRVWVVAFDVDLKNYTPFLINIIDMRCISHGAANNYNLANIIFIIARSTTPFIATLFIFAFNLTSIHILLSIASYRVSRPIHSNNLFFKFKCGS